MKYHQTPSYFVKHPQTASEEGVVTHRLVLDRETVTHVSQGDQVNAGGLGAKFSESCSKKQCPDNRTTIDKETSGTGAASTPALPSPPLHQTCQETNNSSTHHGLTERVEESKQPDKTVGTEQNTDIRTERREEKSNKTEHREERSETRVTWSDRASPNRTAGAVQEEKLQSSKSPPGSRRSSKSPSPIEELFWQATAVSTRSVGIPQMFGPFGNIEAYLILDRHS